MTATLVASLSVAPFRQDIAKYRRHARFNDGAQQGESPIRDSNVWRAGGTLFGDRTAGLE
jgi:hypothetical protein